MTQDETARGDRMRQVHSKDHFGMMMISFSHIFSSRAVLNAFVTSGHLKCPRHNFGGCGTDGCKFGEIEHAEAAAAGDLSGHTYWVTSYKSYCRYGAACH